MNRAKREYRANLIMKVAVWAGCVAGYSLVPSYFAEQLGKSSELMLASGVILVDAMGRLGLAATLERDVLRLALRGGLLFLLLPILPVIFKEFADLRSGVVGEATVMAQVSQFFWASCLGGLFATIWTEV